MQDREVVCEGHPRGMEPKARREEQTGQALECQATLGIEITEALSYYLPEKQGSEGLYGSG